MLYGNLRIDLEKLFLAEGVQILLDTRIEGISWHRSKIGSNVAPRHSFRSKNHFAGPRKETHQLTFFQMQHLKKNAKALINIHSTILSTW